MAETLIPEAPITQFQLPIFATSGYKRWHIEGKQGHFLADNSRVEIKSMRLKIFDGTPDLVEQATLESPAATLYLKDRRAQGDSFLFLTTPLYTVVGHGWTWSEGPWTEGNPKPGYKVTLSSDVRVVFKDALDRLFVQTTSKEI